MDSIVMGSPIYLGLPYKSSIDVSSSQANDSLFGNTVIISSLGLPGAGYDAPRVPASLHWDIGEVEEMANFRHDFYYRVYVNPSNLELGNLLSDQLIDLFVWNAHLKPVTFDSLQQQDLDGISVTGDTLPPANMRSLQEFGYKISIPMSGPPTIDGYFEFDFSTGEAIRLSVTGSRVIVLEFIPSAHISERLEWRTDVMQAFGAEQRMGLRQAPRQSYSLEWLLDNQEYSRMRTQAIGWSHRVFSVPVWAELSLDTHDVLAGDLRIDIDTRYSDYHDGGVVGVLGDDGRIQAYEIDTVFDDHIELKRPASFETLGARIVPLRFARALDGFTFERDGSAYIRAKATLSAYDTRDLAYDDWPSYRGARVMLDRHAMIGSLSDRVSWLLDVFDNGTGLIETDIQTSWARNRMGIGFIKQGHEAIWQVRRWLHARKGRWKAFYIPTWNRDLEVLDTITPATLGINIKSISWGVYLDEADIMIQLKDGTRFFRHISGVIAIPDGEQITMDNSLGQEVAPDDIDFICFLYLVRLDADSVTIEHRPAQSATISISVIEVPT